MNHGPGHTSPFLATFIVASSVAYKTWDWVTNAVYDSMPSFDPTPLLENEAPAVQAINPFELMRTCPIAENVCGIFDNANAFFPYGEYLGQAGQYLPFVAQGAQVLGALNNLRRGEFLNAARRASLLGTQAVIHYVSPEYGLVALPVSMVVNHLFDRAGRRNQTQPQAAIENALATMLQAPTFTPQSAALSLGVEVQELDNDMFQIVDDGEEVGTPGSRQVLQGLATYASQNGWVNFENVEYDYANQTITLDGGVAIPFAEIESLFKLTHEDLPTLVQLGVVDLSVSDEGEVTLTLNTDQLPQQQNLTYGQKNFVRLLQQQSDNSLTVAANRSDFKADPKSAQEITSYLESGLVPVKTSQGDVLCSPAVVGAAVAKGLDVEGTLRNPKEDGTLVLRFKKPARQRDGVMRNSSETVEVPARDLQRAAHGVVEVKLQSLYEQHQAKVNKYA